MKHEDGLMSKEAILEFLTHTVQMKRHESTAKLMSTLLFLTHTVQMKQIDSISVVSAA